MARGSLPEGLVNEINELRKLLASATDRLARSSGADILPPAVFQGLNRNVVRRIDRLERRFTAAVKRRGNDALRDAAIARGALFPFGVAQERAVNFVPLLARYGDELMDRVAAEVRTHISMVA
jgi:uncharacterized protein YllA (UPF0747 family)